MIYYRVRKEYDNFPQNPRIHDGNILVGGELFTEKEVEKYGRRWANRNNVNRGVEIEYTPSLKKKFLENFIEREIPKNKTYWCFGARFPFEEYKMEA